MYTLDKRRLTERVKALPTLVIQRVDEGMKLVLGL